MMQKGPTGHMYETPKQDTTDGQSSPRYGHPDAPCQAHTALPTVHLFEPFGRLESYVSIRSPWRASHDLHTSIVQLQLQRRLFRCWLRCWLRRLA